jgi:hypothetical protein
MRLLSESRPPERCFREQVRGERGDSNPPTAWTTSSGQLTHEAVDRQRSRGIRRLPPSSAATTIAPD